MKRTFTLLTTMVLMATCIFAQEHSNKRSNRVAAGFSKSRIDQPKERSDRNLSRGVNDLRIHKRSLKSAGAIKQRLDNYTAEAYDAISGQWIPDERFDLIYDINQNLSKFLYYEWDSNTSQWISDGSEEYSYDASGNLTQYLYTEVDEITNETVIYGQYVYSYDGQGNLTQEISYDFDELTSQLVADRKYEYTYNASGKLIQETGYEFDVTTNQMIASWKTDYTYNDNGMETQEILSYWENASWRKTWKYESTYNSNGNKSLQTESYWIPEYNKWDDPTWKSEYSYNANGNLIQESGFNKGSNNQWVPYFKNDYNYDAYGNNTQQINYYDWDETSGKWTDVWKEEFTFNNNFTFNDLILPFDEDVELFTHMLTEINEYTWNSNTLTWNLDYKSIFGYSEQNFTSVNHREKDIVSVYPNPFAESVTINLPASYSKITFDLFDPQGRKLMTRLISSDQQVSLQELNKGMYVYRLNVDGKIQSGKLVKD